jgi:hypothetical protein
MKAKNILYSILLFAAFSSCRDECERFSIGLITGPDYRECVCCGGYFIEIDKDTYRFSSEELPEGSIDLVDAQFPIKVRVRWHLKENGCLGDEILITKISLIN